MFSLVFSAILQPRCQCAEPKLHRNILFIQNATPNMMLMVINCPLFLLFSAFSFSQCPLEFMVSKRARGGAGKRQEKGTRAWLDFLHFGERRMSSSEDNQFFNVREVETDYNRLREISIDWCSPRDIRTIIFSDRGFINFGLLARMLHDLHDVSVPRPGKGTTTIETYNDVQGSAKRWSPGCVNAAGKARQKWQARALVSPNLGTTF